MSDPLRDALEKAQAELKAERNEFARAREDFESQLRRQRLQSATELGRATIENNQLRAKLDALKPVPPATNAEAKPSGYPTPVEWGIIVGMTLMMLLLWLFLMSNRT